MWLCASGCAIAWWAPIGVLKTARSLAYAVALLEGVAGQAEGERRRHDALGVEPGEQLHEAAVLVADERVGGQPDVVDEDLELVLRRDDLHRDRGGLEALGVGRHDEQARLELAGPGVLGARDDEHVVGLVDAGDPDLAAVEHPAVAVAARGGGDVVGVGAGVGLGDREGHRAGAVAQAGQPLLLLRLGAVAGDDRAADRRADDHQQQRAALRGELLADRGDVADAAAPAAVLLGDVDAEVAVLADLEPEVGGLAAGAGLLGEVLAAVLAGQLGDLRAQLLALLGLGERASRCCSFFGCFHDGQDLSGATCAPGWTLISVTVPAVGAVTVCCIFMASRTRTTSPAATSWPASTATCTTVPGIGASRLPLATASAGSTNRAAPVSARCPPGRRRRRPPCAAGSGDRARRPPRTTSGTAVDLEASTRGRDSRPTTVHAVDDVAVATAPPTSTSSTVAPSSNSVRLRAG